MDKKKPDLKSGQKTQKGNPLCLEGIFCVRDKKSHQRPTSRQSFPVDPRNSLFSCRFNRASKENADQHWSIGISSVARVRRLLGGGAR
jgi:hypothetical protein